MYKLDLKIKELLEILETYSVGVDGRTKNRKVNLCMDSREPAKGVVFWPIKGARFDAHQFVTQMEKNGALMSVVNADAEGIENFKMYAPVDDTTKALLKLAKGYQKNFKVKKVAITGSNGKTTTKEMVKAVLSQKYNTHATAGNFNNHIGVPMTLFQLKHSHEAAVIEMGTSGPDEIRPLSLAVEPDVAVMKAGIFNAISRQFQVQKLEKGTNLFTSDGLREDFPGRVFRIGAVHEFHPRKLARELSAIESASIAVRNFPLSAEELRKTLKIKDGNACYLFGCTLSDGRRVVIETQKACPRLG